METKCLILYAGGVNFLFGVIMTGKKVSDFESSLSDLEKIVGKLEAGELTLDKSIQEFEKGVSLYKNCKKELDRAEKKISKLTEALREEEID